MAMQAINDLGGMIDELIKGGISPQRAREIVGGAFFAGINAQRYRQGEIKGVIEEQPLKVVKS